MLLRVSFQGPKTLRATYEFFIARGLMGSEARLMLALLPGLEVMCADLPVWGMTSHAHLWLLPASDEKAPHLVLVVPLGSMGYRVGYRKTSTEPSEQVVWIGLEVATPDAAVERVAMAMHRSGGWNISIPSPPAA